MAVLRNVVECNVCSSKTLLRIQIGYIETVPIAVGCSSCLVTLHGSLIIDSDNVAARLEMDNAAITTEETNLVNEIECSGEFPVQVHSSNPGEPRVSPFMTALDFMGQDNYHAFVMRTRAFQEKWKSNRSIYISLFDLYKVRNFSRMTPLLEQLYGKNLDRDDLSLKTAFYDEVIFNLGNFLAIESFQEKVIDKHVNRFVKIGSLSSEQLSKMVHCLNYNVDESINAALGLILNFYENFEVFVPVVCLEYVKGCPRALLKENSFRVTSFDFDKNKQLFVDSYEWLNNFLTILLGVENIKINGEFNKMSPVKVCKRQKVLTLNDFQQLNNGNKKNITKHHPFVSDFHSTFMNLNQMRNAIGHYKTKYCSTTQIITYYLFTNVKKSHKAKELECIRFAYNSYKMLLRIFEGVYLLELLLLSINKQE